MYKPDDISNFKDAVRHLCVYSAQVQLMADALKRGESVSSKVLAFSLARVKCYRGYVLEDLNRMGIKAKGIEFMEDNEFFGFSIKEGKILLTERRDVVMETCRKWIYGFPDSANWYQYGAAMYALALAFPDVIDPARFYPPGYLSSEPLEAAA